ncbi:(6-4)DNA photolyase [Phytophthora citrophthora]|uniref:(6-4)DNA photolyase n=1 Tax=Phytophthora citrophthora TaxID=4793 RepID=A0AAD9LDT3_9STRA|nr:(6-4)DNA photolyase [Phytophthora citrophthora]
MARKRQRSVSTENSDDLQQLETPIQNSLEVADTDWAEFIQDSGNSNDPTITSTSSSLLDVLDGEMKTDPHVQEDKSELGTKVKQSDVDVSVPKRRAVIWFRRDLRLHDNLALDAAIRAQQQLLKTEKEDMALLPIYILHRPKRLRCGPMRFQFLLESIQDLAKSIEKLHGRLLVLRGEAEEVLRVVLKAWGVTDLFFEAGVMSYAVERDDRVKAIARTLNINVTAIRGVTLYDPHEIIRLNGGKPPTDYERLLEITENMPQPAQPIAAPVKLTNAAVLSTSQLVKLLKDFCKDDPSNANSIVGGKVDTENADSELFRVPGLAVFGMTSPDPHTPLVGGEIEGLKRLEEFCKDKRRVGLFEKPKTSPVAVNAPSTTCLSAYLCFGCLSAREFFYRIMFIQLQFPLRPGPTQVTLEGQLMWREFFYCYACGTPNFASQERNPGCKQIEWRLRDEEYVTHPEYDQQKPITPLDADEKLAMHQFQCWKDGRTGFPWIDAVMRQINQEGWTHHAGRHAAACFLTRGVLYISWLRGAIYFQEKLVDMDWPMNVGNWLWVSASVFFTNYRHVSSPFTFPQRWDQQGHFIRKYVPELRNMPDKFVHEPWKASLKVQRDAGCLIGKNYPFPIVDSKLALSRCITGMSLAYSDSETESTASSVSSSRTQTDDADTGGSSPWSADDMCYNYRGPASISQP